MTKQEAKIKAEAEKGIDDSDPLAGQAEEKPRAGLSIPQRYYLLRRRQKQRLGVIPRG